MNDLKRDLRTMFERREADLREPRFAPTHAPKLVRRRTRRRQVGVVLAAVVAVTALAIGSTAGALVLFRGSERRVPANPNETVPPPFLDREYTVRVATGRVPGETLPWEIWASEDLRCLAFASADGLDSGCGEAYGGRDLMPLRECELGCPVVDNVILYGVVSSRVTAVELLVDDGTTYIGTIHPSQPEVTSGARVFTVVTGRGRFEPFTATLTVTGADGSVLGQARYPLDSDTAGGPSLPSWVEATLASGVPVNHDGRASEPDRWEISIWRNLSGDWCLGTIYPNASLTNGRAIAYVGWFELPPARVATEGNECGSREAILQGIRSGAIGHADVWSMPGPVLGDRWSWTYPHRWRWTYYRAWGTVSEGVAAVRLEIGDGQVVDATLYDPPPGFENMGRLFVAEFRSRHEWGEASEDRITWRAVALGPSGEVLGTDEMSATM
jgi:hypothetical protein